MRRFIWGLMALALAAALTPAAASYPGASSPLATAQAVLDEELVILRSDGQIVVEDPFTPPGVQPVEWESPGGSWSQVTTGDFNGDGTAEILAVRGGEARVFDPVVPPGRPAVTFEVTVAGEEWRNILAADIDDDGRDEIIMTRTSSEASIAERLQAYDGNADGTSWTRTFNQGYGLRWKHLAAGDVNNDGDDEIAAIRNREDPTDRRITIWDPSDGWRTLHDRGSYDFRWLTIEIGDTHDDASGKDEIVTTRQDVLGEFDSLLLFRCCSGSQLIDVAGGKFFPYFFDVALGDINNSGDEEVFMLRDTADTSSLALVMRNYGSDGAIDFEILRGQGQWKNIELGDTDGDDRDELIIMSADEYRIYTQPHANKNFEPYPGSYASNGSFAVGNIDGEGGFLGPTLALSEKSFTLNLEAGQSDTRTVQVTNVGDDTVINWTASVVEGSPWLTVNPASGATPGVLQLRINTSSLLAGSYSGRVRVNGGSGVEDSPQDITVSLTVTAPLFGVAPDLLYWFYQQGAPSSVQTVRVIGPGLRWHAGVVPLNSAQPLVDALNAGAALQRTAEGWRADLDDAPLDVPIVDWVDVTPSSGTASVSGSPVLLSLVPDRTPRGYSEVAVVFVTERGASPRAAVVELKVLAYRDEGDLSFIPLAATSN